MLGSDARADRMMTFDILQYKKIAFENKFANCGQHVAVKNFRNKVEA